MDFKKTLQQIAKSYEDEGYTVIVTPDKDRLPEFAIDFGPDLLAIRANERVLVEVKQDRTDLEKDPTVVHHAEVTSKQPGWRFDLHILEGDDPLREVAIQPTPVQIEAMLVHAEALLTSLPQEIAVQSPGIDEAIRQSAFLHAWAGLEAASRHSLQRDHRKMELQPTVLIRELYATGRISLPEYHLLETNRQMRNSLVHGFGPISVHPNQVQSIVELARRLLSSTTKSQSA
jgi:hypothetical protein